MSLFPARPPDYTEETMMNQNETFTLQLQMPGGNAVAVSVPQIPGGGAIVQLPNGKKAEIGQFLGRDGYDVFFVASYAADNATITPLVAPPAPPDSGIAFRYIVAHRENRTHGPRPKAAWAIFRMLEEFRGLVAEDTSMVDPALLEVMHRLNELDESTEWTDEECRRVHILAWQPDRVVGDFTTKAAFMSRAIEARRHVGGMYSDAALATECPHIAAVLNQLLPARKLLPEQQAEVDRLAAEKAAREQAAAAQAVADENALGLAVNAFTESQKKALPARQRVAHLAHAVKAFLDNPRLIGLATREAASGGDEEQAAA